MMGTDASEYNHERSVSGRIPVSHHTRLVKDRSVDPVPELRWIAEQSMRPISKRELPYAQHVRRRPLFVPQHRDVSVRPAQVI